MSRYQESLESILRGSIRLLDTFADPTLDADGREFCEQAIVKADALLLDRRHELPALQERLLQADDAHSHAVARYITRLLVSYDYAERVAADVLAKAAR